MSSIETAVIAAAAKPFFERLISCIWDGNARRANYLKKFKDNHEDLIVKRRELQGLSRHVKQRVDVEENNPEMKCTPMVAEWFKSVDKFENEADVISKGCSGEIDRRCCGGYGPTRCCARYTLGKQVCKKRKAVTDLISQGQFDVVTSISLPDRVQVRAVNRTVGDGAIFGEVWKWLGDDTVDIIGIYGMGGIGKTTLLKKIHGTFLLKDGDLAIQANTFEMVIWVDVSRNFSMENVQKQIGQRLGLTWSEDESQKDKAQSILNVLSKKKFGVWLNDVWEPLKLEDIGIPSSQNNSKVLITTRSEKVCRYMECKKKLKMPFLAKNYAWELFERSVGLDTLESSTEIPDIAKEIAEECGGLPLALIMIGKAMAAKQTAREWKHAIKTLKYYASKFEDMDQKVLAILKFSYDALEDEKVRNCFLYFSLYPEDFHINIGEIVQRWIGEGFLDISEGMNDAVVKGYNIINTLKEACLLEGYHGKYFVKMHGIVRDLALWIGRDEEHMFFVESGFCLAEMPNVKSWTDAARISLMDNKIIQLTGAPRCPCLVTLMLQDNNTLSTIPDGFFQNMLSLRVLDLSETSIVSIPKSIGMLYQLRFLNLCDTEITTLPDEVVNLVNLNYLNLDTNGPITIPHALISGFTRVTVLLSGSVYAGDGNRTDFVRARAECLHQVKELRVSMNVPPPSVHMTSITSIVIFRCKGLSELMSSPLLVHIRRLPVLAIVYEENENHPSQTGQRYGFSFDFAERPSVSKWKSIFNFGRKLLGNSALERVTI